MIENVKNLKQNLINFVKKSNPQSKMKKIKKIFPTIYKKIKKLNLDYVKLKNYDEKDLMNLFQTNMQTAIILKQMINEEEFDYNFNTVSNFSHDKILIDELTEQKVNYLEIDKVTSLLTKSKYLIHFEKNYSLTTKLIEMNISFYKLLFLPMINIISLFQIQKKDAEILFTIFKKYIKNYIRIISLNLDSIKNSSGYFIGERFDLKFNGLCVYYFSNGDKLTGMVKDNLHNGIGKFFAKCGDIYSGEYKDGLKHGYGFYEWANGDIYEGEWKNNLRSGYGVYITKNGFTYEGEWNNNEKNGLGFFHNRNDPNEYKDTCSYYGQWKDNMKEGYGFSQMNKEIFEGEFKKMNKEGYGYIDYGNGIKYEGYFKKGFRDNIGKLFFDDGESMYIGQFKNGQKYGYGVCKYKNGDAYEGNWLYDKYNGKGVFKQGDTGNIIQGNWENGIFIQ